ncbi:unnamed protein product [Chrysoparadoxa australica]
MAQLAQAPQVVISAPKQAAAPASYSYRVEAGVDQAPQAAPTPLPLAGQPSQPGFPAQQYGSQAGQAYEVSAGQVAAGYQQVQQHQQQQEQQQQQQLAPTSQGYFPGQQQQQQQQPAGVPNTVESAGVAVTAAVAAVGQTVKSMAPTPQAALTGTTRPTATAKAAPINLRAGGRGGPSKAEATSEDPATAGAAAAAAHAAASHASAAAANNPGPSAPVKENTGRWTYEEHRAFLKGLELHGKGWKKIAALIKTRTVVQIRTHAQKYFQKLAKAKQNGEHGEVLMDSKGGSSKKSGRSGKRKLGDIFCEPTAVAPSLKPYVGNAGALEPALYHFLSPPCPIEGEKGNGPWESSSKTSPVTATTAATPNGLVNGNGLAPTGGTAHPNGAAPGSTGGAVTGPIAVPSWYKEGQNVEILLGKAEQLDWAKGDKEASKVQQTVASTTTSGQEINPASVAAGGLAAAPASGGDVPKHPPAQAADKPQAADGTQGQQMPVVQGQAQVASVENVQNVLDGRPEDEAGGESFEPLSFDMPGFESLDDEEFVSAFLSNKKPDADTDADADAEMTSGVTNDIFGMDGKASQPQETLPGLPAGNPTENNSGSTSASSKSAPAAPAAVSGPNEVDTLVGS